MWATIVAALLVLLPAGCAPAAGDAGNPATAPDAPATDRETPTTGPDAPVGTEAPVTAGPTVTPEPVEPSPGTVDPRPVAVEGVEELPGSAARVTFYKGVEPCSVFDRIEVEESEGSVMFTVYVGAAPDATDTPCIEIAKLVAAEVPLEAPIGDRAIVDGSA